jgi:long-chain acyl-CoA synthetase
MNQNENRLNVAAAVVALWEGAGTRVAIRSADTGDELTATALADGIRRVAAALRTAGIVPGDRVALSCGNVPAFAVFYYGIMQAGAVAVPLNPRMPAQAVTASLRQADVRGALYIAKPGAESEAGEIVEAFLAAAPDFLWVDNVAPPPGRERVSPLATILEDADPQQGHAEPTPPTAEAVVIGTSGTTGPGKGVRLSHENVYAAGKGFGERAEFSMASNVLIVMPLSSSFGQVALLTGSLLHGSLATISEPFKPPVVAETLAHHGITHFVGVPTMYAALKPALHALTAPDARERLRAIWYGVGGAPVPDGLPATFAAEFGMPLRQGYGLTETASVTTFNRFALPEKAHSAGPPLKGSAIVITGNDGAPVPPGETGEVVVCGANVMLGYLGQPPLTEQRLPTGDIGWVDEEGHLYIVDRLKDLIIRGGENIVPRQVEALLCAMEGVTHAAVIGKPDAYYGEVPVAYLVCSGAVPSLEAVQARLREVLPPAAIPVAVYPIGQLPLGPTGKILKRELREKLISQP